MIGADAMLYSHKPDIVATRPTSPIVTLASAKAALLIASDDASMDGDVGDALDKALDTVGGYLGIALMNLAVVDYYSRISAGTQLVLSRGGGEQISVTQSLNGTDWTTINASQYISDPTRDPLVLTMLPAYTPPVWSEYIAYPVRVSYTVPAITSHEHIGTLREVVKTYVRVARQTDAEGNLLPGGERLAFQQIKPLLPALSAL